MAKKGRTKEDKPAYSGDGKKDKPAYSVEELEEMNRKYAKDIKLIRHVNDLKNAKYERELKKYMDREAKQEQEIAELKLKISNIENTNTEEEHRRQVEELNNIKDSYEKKMKNTVALQRLKYEKQIQHLNKLHREHSKFLKSGAMAPEEPDQADYDKLDPEEKLSKLTEAADELYLCRAKMLYKQWHSDMADKMSITGMVALSSVSLNRFEEKVKVHLEKLRASEADFRDEMHLGYPDVALGTYFSEFVVKMLAGIAEDVHVASMSSFENRMLVKKEELKEKKMDALTIRNNFVYEVDFLKGMLQGRKKEQPAP